MQQMCLHHPIYPFLPPQFSKTFCQHLLHLAAWLSNILNCAGCNIRISQFWRPFYWTVFPANATETVGEIPAIGEIWNNFISDVLQLVQAWILEPIHYTLFDKFQILLNLLSIFPFERQKPKKERNFLLLNTWKRDKCSNKVVINYYYY